jgi:hypothetical protein
MQRCPKCGYREVDWPAILTVLAFAALYGVFILAVDHAPLGLRIVGIVAFFLFLAANSWRLFRHNKNQREYLKLHPPPDQRVKNHLKPAAPGR